VCRKALLSLLPDLNVWECAEEVRSWDLLDFSRRHLNCPSPNFHKGLGGGKKCEIWPRSLNHTLLRAAVVSKRSKISEIESYPVTVRLMACVLTKLEVRSTPVWTIFLLFIYFIRTIYSNKIKERRDSYF